VGLSAGAEGTPEVAVARVPDTSEWVVLGQPLSDARLRRQIDEALRAAAGDVPAIAEPQARDVLAQDAAELALDRALDHITDALTTKRSAPALAVLSAHAAALHRLQRALGDARLTHRSQMFARVQAALSRLRELGTTDQAIRAIATEALTLGFSRIIVSRVLDGHWIPEACLIEGDTAWGEEILAAGRADPQRLDHMILETEMVRLRAPILVRDVQNDPRTHRPIADASFSRSYVTAPLLPEGRVIGFIHADCYMTQRDVDEFDRDVLWMFAEGAGYAFERTVLLERLRDLRERVRQLTGSIEAVIDEVVDAEVEMARLDRQTAAVTRAASAAIVQPQSQLRTLLTRRELEIAQLMADGLTNPEIARRLVISEGTVKTHVSNLLRKLHASNRAQAASTFMRLAQSAEPGA
jgi:LuxR family transcriptional regulator, regulator of acetate metabolism